MKTENIVARIVNIPNGAWFKLTYASELDRYLTAVAKRSGHSAAKITTGTFRKGIRYSKQKAVIAKAEKNGFQPSNELPWGSWIPGEKRLKNVFIEHKGERYLRLYFGPNKTHSVYYLDGRKVTYEELKNSGLFQPSYFAKSEERSDCIVVKCSNIISL